MDCEKFDQHLMDALYDELDELTRADLRRHAEACPRCATAEASLRATVELAVLPLEKPDESLEERILAAARASQREAPWYRKVVQMVAWAGSHAMRPQFAMAALLMLVLGSSVLLLRARPGAVAITPVRITEQGAPAPPPGAAAEATAGAVAGVDEAARGRAGRAGESAESGLSGDGRPEGETAQDEGAGADSLGAAGAAAREAAVGGDEQERFERGLADYRAGRMAQARAEFAAVAAMGGPRAATAALYEARAVRSEQGCAAAIVIYERVRTRHAGSGAAADAAWEQADCHRMLGEMSAAEELWRGLESDANYGRRATNELADRGEVATSSKQPAAGAATRSAEPAGASKAP